MKMARQSPRETMMRIALIALVALGSGAANACPKCRPLVEAGVFNASFAGNLAAMALPLALVGIIGAALYFAEPLLTCLGERG